MALRRITKEWKDVEENPIDGCAVAPVQNKEGTNFMIWKGTIEGPMETPYQTGMFNFTVTFPEQYPFKKPYWRFDPLIYHVNINDKGVPDCRYLHGEDGWTPAMTIGKLIYEIRNLFLEPDTENYCIPERAKLFKTNRCLYDSVANEWTVKYANGTLDYEQRYKIISNCLENIFEGMTEVIEPIIIEFDGKHLNKLSKKRLMAIKEENEDKVLKGVVIKDEIKPTQSIMVKTLTGRLVEIYCFLSDSVILFKTRIADKDGIPPNQQKIMYKGRYLENDRKMTDYHLKYGDTVHLVLPFGGTGG